LEGTGIESENGNRAVKSISKIFITVVDMYRPSHRREVLKNKIFLRVAV